MRARQVTLGVIAYLGGAAALLTIALAIEGVGLTQAVSGGDLIALLVGALVIGLGAWSVQKPEVRRPIPHSGDDGGRPRQGPPFPLDDVSWTTLTGVFGAAIALAIVPRADAAEEEPVHPARGTFEALVIDGDRDGTSVTMRHHHIDERMGGAERACVRCHHMNLPGEEATPCSECHQSMTRPHDTFDHDLHIAALGGNTACQTCHPDPDEPRVRDEMQVTCADCHTANARHAWQRMVPPGATIQFEDGVAPSYVDAMHGLCLDCHRSVGEEHARCTVCHHTGGIRDGQPRPGRQ